MLCLVCLCIYVSTICWRLTCDWSSHVFKAQEATQPRLFRRIFPSHLFLEDFIVVKPRPSGYLAIASNKATIQNNYTVQENPGLSYMNLHAWHVFKEVSIFSMCFHVFRFLSMCSKSHRLINASSWCVQSISICKGCGLLGLASSQMGFFWKK